MNILVRSRAALIVATLLGSYFSPAAVLADNLVANGDFSNGLNGWTPVNQSNPPFIGTAANYFKCYNVADNPAGFIDAYSSTNGALEQTITLPAGQSYTLTFREWGQFDPSTVHVVIYDQANVPTVLDTYTAELLVSGYTYPGPVFQCSGAVPVTKSYDISSFAGQTIKLHFDASAPGNDGTFAVFDDVTIDGESGIKGTVKYQRGSTDGVAGVTLHLTGTTDTNEAVDKTVKSGNHGQYSFDVSSGSYTVEATGEGVYVGHDGTLQDENGGILSAETADGANCGGSASKNTCKITLSSGSSATADFSYTLCAADDRKPNGKPLTHCPVVLVPGFLGSKIACNGSELWPNVKAGVAPLPAWGQMLLQADGVSNDTRNACNAAAAPLQNDDGVVGSAGSVDVYQGLIDFLNDQFASSWRASPYDWRKSPVLGAELLDQTVKDALSATKAKHVVLLGHSMGGLVIREYLNSHADKVTRVLTEGTPYWGAPKSHFALLGGFTDTPAGSALDYVTWAPSLQLLARNLQGLFFLYPDTNFGSWLFVSPSAGKPLVRQSAAGEDLWVSALGGNPHLLNVARAWHAANDGFPQTDIDYRAVVGSGTATTVEFKDSIGGLNGGDDYGQVVLGNGDGTVPLRSATQGASDGGSAGAPIYYACGVGHVDLPVDSLVLAGIRDFLIAGSDVVGLNTKCPYSGTELVTYDLNFRGVNTVTVDPNAAHLERSSASAQAASSRITLDEAIKEGLVQFMIVGGTTIILTDDAKPVTLTINGSSVAFQLKKFGSNGDGPLQAFKPVKGPVSISASGQAHSSSGNKLTPIKGSGTAPTTKAKLSKKGKTVTIKLTATGTTGVHGTYYQVGSGKVTKYSKAFKVKLGRKPIKIVYYSINPFGVIEKKKSVTAR